MITAEHLHGDNFVSIGKLPVSHKTGRACSRIERRLEKYGVGITPDQFKKFEHDESCVLRALGSVAGEVPQFEDKIIRIRQMIRNNKVSESGVSSQPQALRDLENVKRLPRVLAKAATPLGESLDKLICSHAQLDADGIKREILQGGRVVAVVSLNNNTAAHAVHVHPSTRGPDLFVGKSDRVKSVYEIRQTVHVLIFKEKASR